MSKHKKGSEQISVLSEDEVAANHEDESHELCDRCKVGEAEREHTCPFLMEIYGKHDTCNCCDDCEYQCAMDV